MTNSIQRINLLWTGGWDSTFQLLQTTLVNKAVVQPYYIVDPNRKSMIRELMAIRKIRESLISVYPETKDLILPILFKMVDDIVIDSHIEQAFLEFRREKHMGIQYLWLASFCKKEGIYDMQLSIEKSNIPDPNLWDSSVIDKLIDEKTNGITTTKVNPSFRNTKEFTIFQYFTFPLIHSTKEDMLHIARQNNWLQFMDQSWFCLFPTRKNEPCGICKPCIQTITEGFAYRMPRNRRIYSAYMRHIENPSKALVKKFLQPVGLARKERQSINLSPLTLTTHPQDTKPRTDLL